jgi:undecaprenyl pyrophosphate phosphatase UppP
MTDERYARLNQIWTNIVVVQITLLVVGSLLHNDRVIYASLAVGGLCVGVGMVVLNERSKRIEAAKEKEQEASEQ